MTERPAGLTRRTAKLTAVWFAILAGLVMATAVLVMWYGIDQRAHEHAGSATDQAIRMNELLIQQDARSRLLALDRLASRLVTSGEGSREGWEADAKRYMVDMPGFAAIHRIDKRLKSRWHVVADSGSSGKFDVMAVPAVIEALERARDSRVQVFSDVFTDSQGTPCVAVIVPALHHGEYEGVIAGFLHPRQWLESVIGHLHSGNHHIEILLQNQSVYRHEVDGDIPNAQRLLSRGFSAGGLEWTIQVTPTSSFLSAGHADSSTLVLAIGLLLSVLTAFVIYFAFAARDRSRRYHDIAAQLATLFRNLPGVAYQRTNAPGTPMAFISEGCRALSGYPGKDFTTGERNWLDLVTDEDRERVADALDRALASREAFEIEYRIVDRQGTLRWVWERGRAVLSEVDHQVHVEGFISDITDRKQAANALIEARAFSEAVVDTAADAVITIDPGGHIETFNRAAQKMFGYTLDEAIGLRVEKLMPAPYRNEHGEFVKRYLESDEPDSSSAREVKALRKDGSVFPIHLSISDVRANNDRKIVGLIRDVSEQRAAESEAREHREHLAHVDRLNMLGEMATGIAHEINQPLTAISLFVQAGGRLVDNQKYDRVPEIFDKLIQHSHRASAVIERMQNMARRRESAKEQISCEVLVGEVAKLAEAEARIRDMTIEVEIEAGLPDVSVDAVQIQQVALNLLRNGMESMQSVDCKKGNVIGLRAKMRGDEGIEFAVVDSGAGVPEEAAEKLFAPFSTTKKSGMGMGLSISRAIVTAHGGRLDFFNNEEGGATFFFTLQPVGESGNT